MRPTPPTASDLTVMVSSDDVDGRAVRDLAFQWRADGLLGDFAWVTPAEVERGPYGPPVIRARLTERGAPVELMSHIGMRPRSLIRIVLLHLLTHEMSDPDTLVYTCDEIAELVNRARPRALDPLGRHHGSQLLRVNLMVPESDLLPQDPRIILPAWEVNAVVSPEDRPELDRQSIFVRRSVNLHSHALAAAATVGSLWSSVDAGVFDSHESDSTTGGGEIVVMRCQARVVVGDDGVEDLTRAVITSLQESPVGASAWVPWGVPSDNPAALVRSCTERLMTHPEWTPLEREWGPLLKEQISVHVAVRQWLGFQLRLFPAMLHFLFGWGRGLVERQVTALTVGRDAGEEGKLRPLPPDKVKEVAELRMQKLEDELRPTRLEEEAAAWGQATPAAWRELRDLAIGLVDGSRLSERFARPSRGGAVEVVPPGYVVGAPDDSYELWSGERVGLVDVQRAGAAVAEIERAREEEARADRARAAAAGGSVGRNSLRASVPPRKTSDEQGGPSDGEDAAGLDPEASEEPAAESDNRENFLLWLEQRRSTLLWQLTVRALELKDRERERAERAQQAIADAKPPSTDKLESAKTFLVTCWGLTVAAFTLVVLLNLISAISDPLDFLTSLSDVASLDLLRVVLVVLTLLLVAGTLYFQAMKSYDWAVTKRMHALTRASDDYVTSRHQERRWKLMHHGLVDWARILSETLHRPWSPPRSPEVEQVPVYGGLPAAVGVAVPVLDQDAPDPRFVARAIELVCQKGWIVTEFARLLERSPANGAGGSHDGGTHGDIPADLDLGLGRTGPRRELAEVAARDDTKQVATRALLDAVSRLAHSGDIRVPARSVMRVGYYSQGETSLDRDFLTPRDQVAPMVTELFSPSAQLAQFQVPERSVLFLPEGIEVPASMDSRQQVSHVPSAGTTTIRVDLSTLVTHDNICLFQQIQRPEYRPTSSPDDYN